MAGPELILTLSCPDRRGIVYAVARAISEGGGNIVDSQQFGDPDESVFFMRVHFADEAEGGLESWRRTFAPLADAYAMQWDLHDTSHRQRILVAVSHEGHCLNDLLYRWQTGALHADMVAVASPYGDFEGLAAGYGVPYHRLPGPDASGPQRDAALLELVTSERIELVVLARYMQILGGDACRTLAGRAINIHHSFLPSFRGARPYAQAHARGVKLIGATAHYVTEELDEGPIIEQEVARVDHAHSVAELARVGRDVECVALARAVRWHVEHRVLLHGARTVVFR
ncbi:formyltetrahydrofolate deformylase [Nocardioides sp.]|uniref:formyltetrahydrofolate deformylase n=1 Tax=Nocardioides sp. TaxID=35761 RepID=UPI002D164D3C|nr:formyltetrahydrofolate deformylase [Nocardioides sp.]HSX66479.1 formyltetrahydrofolate deformylase [Nocardioides sp.]